MSTTTNGDDLGTVLGIWAHPDDETWASAGLMARAIEQGRRVVCVTATRGEAGFPDDDPRSIAERSAIREAELGASLAALGVTEHHWLGYADGGCAAVPDDEAVARVAAFIADVRPDTLLTFPPDGSTGHGDHVSMCRWSTLAVDALLAAGEPAPRLLYTTRGRAFAEELAVAMASSGFDASSVMMIDGFEPETTPEETLPVLLTCDEALLDRKVAALRAQVSQIEPLVAAVGVEAFREFNRHEFFRDRQPGDAERLAQATAFSRQG